MRVIAAFKEEVRDDGENQCYITVYSKYYSNIADLARWENDYLCIELHIEIIAYIRQRIRGRNAFWLDSLNVGFNFLV